MPHPLTVYLQDHHAGAIGGLSLARRIARSNSENVYGTELETLSDEIATDLKTLERIMVTLEVKPDGLKDLGAKLTERLGRLKRNGTNLTYSPGSRLLELEGLVMGITGKLALWRSLAIPGSDQLRRFDLARLTERATDQRDRAEALRSRAVADLLGVA